jgi:hypothetical protein
MAEIANPKIVHLITKPNPAPAYDPEPIRPIFSGIDEEYARWVRADMVWKQQIYEWRQRHGG